MEGAKFLKEKYSLHSSPEVKEASDRTWRRTGEKVPQKPVEQIQNYLDRFKELTQIEDEQKRDRMINALKESLYKTHVIASEDIPESYFELQQKIERERGNGDVVFTEAERKRAVEVIQTDQRDSLDQWVDYLASEDAMYPDWVKYWAMRSVFSLANYDKKKHEFGKRSKDTTAAFPELNAEALAYVADIIIEKNGPEIAELEEKLKQQQNLLKKAAKALRSSPDDAQLQENYEREQTALEDLRSQFSELLPKNPVQEGQNANAREGKKVTDEEFVAILDTESFAKYYAFAIEHVTADNSELYKITEGEWKKYDQIKSDSTDETVTELTSDLQGHGTGWCTAGKATATSQLQKGDFFVYFSNNALGEANIPRLAIRMEGDDIAEVRGVAANQELDSYIAPILEEKMTEFGEQGEEYIEKAVSMKRLTEVEQKSEAQKELSAEELRFLYEFDSSIVGFGNNAEKDPRIDELKNNRSWLADMETIFNTSDKDKLTESLLSNGRHEDLVQNMDFFDHVTLANVLLKEGHAPFLLKNLKKFEGIDQQEVAEQALVFDRGETLAKYLENFKSIQGTAVLDKLIEYGKGREVAKHIDKFIDADHQDAAERLIEKDAFGAGKSAIANIDKFSGADKEDIAKEALDRGLFDSLLENIKKFKNIDQIDLVQKALEAGKHLDITLNIRNINSEHHSEVSRLLLDYFQTVHKDDVSKKYFVEKTFGKLHNNFAELEASVADAMIEYGLEAQVAEQLEKFIGIDHQEIANRISDNALLSNVWKFKELSQETAERVLNSNEKLYRLGNIAEYLDRFVIDDFQKIADLLHQKGEDEQLARNLDKFKNLSPETAMRLLTTNSYAVAANLDSFDDLDREKIAKKLVESGKASQVIENIKNFESISQTVLDQLIATDRGDEMIRHLDLFESRDSDEIVDKFFRAGHVQVVLWTFPEYKDFSSEEIRRVKDADPEDRLEIANEIAEWHDKKQAA